MVCGPIHWSNIWVVAGLSSVSSCSCCSGSVSSGKSVAVGRPPTCCADGKRPARCCLNFEKLNDHGLPVWRLGAGRRTIGSAASYASSGPLNRQSERSHCASCAILPSLVLLTT